MLIIGHFLYIVPTSFSEILPRCCCLPLLQCFRLRGTLLCWVGEMGTYFDLMCMNVQWVAECTSHIGTCIVTYRRCLQKSNWLANFNVVDRVFLSQGSSRRSCFCPWQFSAWCWFPWQCCATLIRDESLQFSTTTPFQPSWLVCSVLRMVTSSPWASTMHQGVCFSCVDIFAEHYSSSWLMWIRWIVWSQIANCSAP